MNPPGHTGSAFELRAQLAPPRVARALRPAAHAGGRTRSWTPASRTPGWPTWACTSCTVPVRGGGVDGLPSPQKAGNERSRESSSCGLQHVCSRAVGAAIVPSLCPFNGWCLSARAPPAPRAPRAHKHRISPRISPRRPSLTTRYSSAARPLPAADPSRRALVCSCERPGALRGACSDIQLAGSSALPAETMVSGVRGPQSALRLRNPHHS